MGCLCPDGDATTQRINREIRQNENRDLLKIKLLFLGAGGSGKSTLFNQLRILYGNGLTEKIRRGYTMNICNNIIAGMKTLVEGNLEMAYADKKGDEKTTFSKENNRIKIKPCDEKTVELIQDISEWHTLSPQTAKVIKMAWADAGIQSTWENRSQLQVQDSLAYFVENVERISKPDYIPSKDDVLNVRVITTGIVEEDMMIQDKTFHIVDVGGQRSERRKWIECFEGVTGIIFVVSLISYNQTLYEDEETNRMKESMILFRDTMKGKHGNNFKESSVVLFLNKDDLFQEMIKKYPITKCFPKYKGELTEEDQYNYIKQKYIDLVAPRNIFIHRTCATDTDRIQVIFNAVNIAIIRKAFNQAGLWLAE